MSTNASTARPWEGRADTSTQSSPVSESTLLVARLVLLDEVAEPFAVTEVVCAPEVALVLDDLVHVQTRYPRITTTPSTTLRTARDFLLLTTKRAPKGCGIPPPVGPWRAP